jgi:hypothetical protein
MQGEPWVSYGVGKCQLVACRSAPAATALSCLITATRVCHFQIANPIRWCSRSEEEENDPDLRPPTTINDPYSFHQPPKPTEARRMHAGAVAI